VTTTEIVSLILKSEEESGVFNLKHKKKNLVWPFFRMYFYYSYLEQKSDIVAAGASPKKINVSRILDFLVLLKNSKLLSLLACQRKDIIIISSQRYVNGNEIYTKEIKKANNGNYLELSFSNRFVFHEGPIYLDLIKIVLKLVSRVSHNCFNTPSAVKHFSLLVEAEKSCEIQYRRYRIEYSCWYWIYDILIKLQKPKKIFLIGGVFLSPLIAVAEKHNIEVIEIQHGVINRFHLSYHFPNRSRETFFPNKLLLLSSYWKTKASYPLGTELISVGNDYFYVDSKKEKHEKTILIIGDGTLYKQLMKFLELNLNFFISNEFEITYKLHPNEVPLWSKRYTELNTLNETNKIRVVASELSIASLIENAQIVFGVNSTSIYESVDAGARTFVLDLQSAEYFNDLVDRGVVKKIDPRKRLDMKDLNFVPKETKRFFDSADIARIETICL
jgi:hypothetical protein